MKDGKALSNKKFREKQLSNGLCISCNNPLRPGTTVCEYHHAKKLEYNRSRVARTKKEGLCRSCWTRERVDGLTLCGRCRIYFQERQKEHNRRVKIKVIEHYGGRCKCCGTENKKYLQLDHVNNDGADHRRNLKLKCSGVYEWAAKNNFPDSLQLLCANCHFAKTIHGGCSNEDHD